MITKWQIHTQRGGPLPRRALVAEVDKIATATTADREFVLRVPITGRHTLLLGNDKDDVRWFREVVLRADGDYSIELPRQQVGVTGNVVAYPESWSDGFAMHGIVGPRLVLEPEKDTVLGLMVALPEPAKFTLRVPAPGNYTVHHHLYETGRLWSEKGHSGGSPLAVTIDGKGDLGDLGLGSAHSITMRIVDAAGVPVNGQLRVRDRMFEAWSFDLRQNTTLDDADDPIPTPPTGRVANGVGKLPRMRAGRVQFVLDLDDGRSVFFARDIDPSREVEAKLPFAVPMR
jgi:hypothetical protein